MGKETQTRTGKKKEGIHAEIARLASEATARAKFKTIRGLKELDELLDSAKNQTEYNKIRNGLSPQEQDLLFGREFEEEIEEGDKIARSLRPVVRKAVRAFIKQAKKRHPYYDFSQLGRALGFDCYESGVYDLLGLEQPDDLKAGQNG